MLDLTIAIPVKNEQAHILRCLDAIGKSFASHIVIIDSSSTDKTRSIAANWGADVVLFSWNGRYPKKRNWFLENHMPSTEWVLFLDADEIVTPNFKAEVGRCLPNSPHQGFFLRYTNYFLGRRLRGGYPLVKPALFRPCEVRYEYVQDMSWSSCDMEVHEHPVFSGSLGCIRSKIDHLDMRGVSSYLSKHYEYAIWESRRVHECLEVISPASALKVKLKYTLLRSPLGGIIFFLISYIYFGGWRDGSVGLAFSLLKLGYFTQIFCLLKELEAQQ